MASQADVSGALQGAGINVNSLQVKDVGGITAVYGTVGSDDERRRAEQAIEGKVGKISNHITVAGGSATAGGAAGSRTYTVKSGDTLSKIAHEMYGKASDWKKIQAANADRIKDPDKIQAGWTLNIPQ